MMDYREIVNELQKDADRLEELRVIVAGKSGAGKTTLIKSVFGDLMPVYAEDAQGLPVTEEIKAYRAAHAPLTLIDTVGFTVLSKDKAADTLRAFMRDKKTAPHLVWYVVNAGTNRLEEGEAEFIRFAAKIAPVVLVITQAVGMGSEVLAGKVREMDLPIDAAVVVLARPFYLRDGSAVESFGIDELLQRSYNLLRESIRDSFASAQVHDVDLKVKAARAWARGYIAATFGVGFLPIPFSDAGILVPLQVTMLVHIARIFGMKANRAELKKFAAAAILPQGATYVGRSIVGEILKLIPGAGTAVGGVIRGSTAASVTWTITEGYIYYLKKTYRAGRREVDADELREAIGEFRLRDFEGVSKEGEKDTTDA